MKLYEAGSVKEPEELPEENEEDQDESDRNILEAEDQNAGIKASQRAGRQRGVRPRNMCRECGCGDTFNSSVSFT